MPTTRNAVPITAGSGTNIATVLPGANATAGDQQIVSIGDPDDGNRQLKVNSDGSLNVSNVALETGGNLAAILSDTGDIETQVALLALESGGNLAAILADFVTLLARFNAAATPQLPVVDRFIVAAASAYTRPANTTAYTAGNAVSNSQTAGSVTAISFSLSNLNDAPFTLERCRILTTDTGPGAKACGRRAWFFNSDPTANSGVQAGNAAAWSQKQAGFIGSMNGTFRPFFDGSGAVLTPDEGSRILTVPVSGAKTVYALLQTLAAFTPSANSTTFTATLEGFQGAP